MSENDPTKAPPTRASDGAVEAAQDLESMSDDQLKQLLEESRIIIKSGGEVVIENLTPSLLDVAYTLDPDNPGIQCRVDAMNDANDEEEP